MVGINYTLMLLLLVLHTRIVCPECPEHCLCDGISLSCSHLMPTKIPDNIQKVSFRGVEFGTRFMFVQPGWANVTHLNINPDDSVFQVKQEPYRTLNAFEFEPLQNLRYLQLACTCLREVDTQAFRGLDRLESLDLSNNVDLNISEISKALKGEHILPSLKELYLSNASVVDYFSPFLLDQNFYDAVRNRSLSVLDLSHTQDTWFDRDGLDSAFPYLEKLNASYAGIGLVSLVHFFLKNSQSSDQSFQKLKVLDVSYPTVSSKLTDLIFGSASHDIFTYVPEGIESIYARRIFTQSLEISGTSNTTHACMSGKTYTSRFQWCIVGTFRHLYIIDFSENMIEYLDPNLLKYPFSKLKQFYISRNKLGRRFLQGDYAASLMKLFPELEIIDLSYNSISGIPRDTFKRNMRLREILLSHNHLDRIHFEFEHMKYLQHLDLEHNNILFLDSTTVDMIQSIRTFQKQFMNEQNNTMADKHKLKTLTIAIKTNPIKCSCESLHFLNWLSQINDSFTCSLEGTNTEVGEYSIRLVVYECKQAYVIVIFSALGFCELITITIMICFVAKEIRNRRKRRKTEKGIQLFNINNEHKNPVVFLSFCSEDGDTVMREVLTNLNEGLQKVLNTTAQCVSTGSTSFMPGFPIGDEIIRCIESASVIVFFVSTAFCSKSWCRYEAMVAHLEKKPIVLMLWDNVETNKMPKSLYKHYTKYTRVHWVRENGELVMKPGWDKLCGAIVRLIGEDPMI